jgi:serine/threonine protein kinase
MAATKRIGNYAVQALIGQGGMGAVYRAEHTVIGRQVAIKILRRELAGESSLVARFLNEARAPGAANHPGIVEVFDVGTLPNGTPYLVMEYLRGESLAQRLTRVGRLDIELAAEIACQTASALAAAHASGIIHRDLKPGNLFLLDGDGATAGEPPRVKVLDFGIAKLLTAGPSNEPSTHSGLVIGTPLYMSPEQCRGARDEVDHRADVYALGTILYQMVSGTPPFVGEGWGELLLRHMTEAPVPPSMHNSAVSPAMEAVILCALAKRREDRFASMDAFRRALLAAVGKGPAVEVVVTPGPSTAAATRPRRSVAFMAGGLALVALVAAAGWAVLHSRGPSLASRPPAVVVRDGSLAMTAPPAPAPAPPAAAAPAKDSQPLPARGRTGRKGARGRLRVEQW